MISTSRTLRVAIIGAGPSGLYTADALTLEEGAAVAVDLIERLPVPFGLLRYGVAPDHPNIKAAAEPLQDVLDRPTVRLFCNVEVGVDIDVAELRKRYDAIVYATGADADNELRIPGEQLQGSESATSFVRWYNGHPEATGYDLASVRAVAVIGAGNVALDVTRILVKSPATLRSTDIDEATLAALDDSAVTDVHIIARRGAEHAKFTTKELRELGELPDVDIVVDRANIPPESAEGITGVAARNIKLLRAWSQRGTTGAARRVHFHFSTRPTAVLGDAVVTGLRVEGTDTGDGNSRSDEIPVELVLRAVGYRSRPIDGIPFVDSTATIPHENHRVVRDGRTESKEYAVGWVKRGPRGILGTNRSDAYDTAQAIFDDRDDLHSRRQDDAMPIEDLLQGRGIRFLGRDAWMSISEHEVQLGASHDRPRVKIRSWDALVAAGLTLDIN